MRLITNIAVLAVVVAIVVPALFISVVSPTLDSPNELEVNLYINAQDRLVKLPLEDYLVGVVAAEMPASFHMEALKAQAVAARTYAVNRLRDYGGRGCDAHPLADLCANPDTDQAWISDEEMRQNWGSLQYPWNRYRISQAVRETRGEVLTHGGQLIDAVYHSTSGGQTEYAEAVWGGDVPYLQSVASEYEHHAPRLTGTQTVSIVELAQALDLSASQLRRQARAGIQIVEVVEYSPTGRAAVVSVGGREWEARELRQALDLPSTWFEVTWDSNRVHFELRGFGHGVGLSQYGADGMGKAGYDYRSILTHYYQGIEIQRLAGDE